MSQAFSRSWHHTRGCVWEVKQAQRWLSRHVVTGEHVKELLLDISIEQAFPSTIRDDIAGEP